MIKLKNLNKYFFKGKKNQIHVLNNISLDLGEKGLVAISGSSGSGKTTLLNVIGGLDKLHSGQIQFYDEYFDKYKPGVWDKIRNEYVGYIFQNYYLLPDLSVYENIRLVLKNLGISDEEEIKYRVHYVLKALGMYPFRKKKATQLSGGQQQRVAIARALVKNPKVIIADEPTGNLDSKNTIEILNIIKEISKETLVILVTHEKELAKLYSDRLIILEDGKIIEDLKNDYEEDHNIVDDAIYLKDIKNIENIKNEKVNLDLYYDEDLKDIDIKLILKNETLYLDVKGYENIKLANESTDVVIKDAHYEKKTKEEVQKTTYDVKELEHGSLKKERGLLFSAKQSFERSFKKFLTLGRKGKLMLFSFFVAGIILAFATSTFFSTMIIDAESLMDFPEGYVEYRLRPPAHLTLDDLNSIKGETEDFFVNPYLGNLDIYFLKSDGTRGINVEYGNVDILSNAKNYKLIKGKYGEHKNEIVVSKGYVDFVLDSEKAQDFGIWNEDNLFYEKIKFHDTDAKIVGIVDTEINLLFASDEFLSFNYNDSFETPYKPLEAFDEISLIKGELPVNKNEVLVNSSYLTGLGIEDINDITLPYEIEVIKSYNQDIRTFYVTGIHDFEEEYLILKLDTIKEMMVEKSPQGYIYSSNPSYIILKLEEELNLEGVDLYEKATVTLKSDRAATITTTIITTSFLVGAILIGFYFVMRSSLIERFYEVAVYRAIGVKKWDIFVSFIFEILLITTITTFIGFTITSAILFKTKGGLMSVFASYTVTPLSFLSGVILLYILNIMAGILPVYLLLRKTPAQILSQYDI